MEPRLRTLLDEYLFTSAAESLGITLKNVASSVSAASERISPLPEITTGKTPVSIVIPCFNEEIALPYLANTLNAVAETLQQTYDIRFVLVDDGSSDGTWAGMQRLFGNRPTVKLVRHDRNYGVAAAILTGIRDSETEIVCSIDCDCSYDPAELHRMIPLLTPEVAMVTASPYHPLGGVRHVPAWRLRLSRGASWMYQRILKQKLSTYTSCFRVYRKSVLSNLVIDEPGFLGVAEMLGKVDLSGGIIVEHPAVLESRLLGRSKMKTFRTILGHLKLMYKLARLRIKNQAQAAVGTNNPPPTRFPKDKNNHSPLTPTGTVVHAMIISKHPKRNSDDQRVD
jgi:glycosyltransferase involved in cell wall biosynthesis